MLSNACILLGVSVLCIRSKRSMPECSHEEADTRIVDHVDAVQTEQAKKVTYIRTADTDVVVILVGKFYELKAIQPHLHLWVAFGMGMHFRFLSINAICELGKARSNALPVFHALSGCDTTFSFYGKGKFTAWQAWDTYLDVTPAFQFMAANPFHQLTLNSEHFRHIEGFTVV